MSYYFNKTLNVSFDVGTENEDLLAHPSYLGIRARRLRGEAYYSLLDEAVEAIHQVAPGAVLQWEDFRNNNAVTVDRLPSFNDDIQGTGAIALAGLLVACRATGARLSDQRVVVFGDSWSGSAACRGIPARLR